MFHHLAVTILGLVFFGQLPSVDNPPLPTGSSATQLALKPGDPATATRDRRIEAVGKYVWGDRQPATSLDLSRWDARNVTGKSLADEVSFAADLAEVAVVSGKEQELSVAMPGGGTDQCHRTIRAYLDANSLVVLKLVIVDETRDGDRADILEPVVADLKEELARRAQWWNAPAPPGAKCLVDALEEVLRWGLGARTLKDSTRIVVHSVATKERTMRGERSGDIWSIDFRDGAVSPRPLHKPSPAVTNLRYQLELTTCKPIRASNDPPPRGSLAEAKARDAEFKRRIDAERARENLPPLAAPTAGHISEKIIAFARKTESLGFSGAVLTARDGKVVAACGVGFADLEGKVANTPETMFEIASASKQFTSAAVVRLAQDGKLGLDDPISKHLPGVPKSCEKITVRHLLQHTSGIPGSNSGGGGNELAKVLPAFLRGGPVHEPGTHFEYWNQGYALASEVIARASGKSYTAYLREALFVPAELPLTRFTGDAAPKVEGVNVAVGRSVMGEPRSALEHPYGEYGFQYRGMGGVVTNVRELWNWDRALAAKGDKAVLSEASLRELFKPGLESYALGWRVGKDAHGRMVQSHGGRVRGFVCEVRRLPDDDGCVIVLANKDDAPVRQVADGVQAILLGKPYVEITPPGPLPGEMLKAIAGKYKDAKGNVLEVVADGGAAKASIVWAANAEWNTRAWIGADEQGRTVWFEWTETTPITVNRPGGGVAVSIEMLGATYSRVREGGPRRRRSGE